MEISMFCISVRVNFKSSKNLDNVEHLDKTIGIPSLSSYAVQASRYLQKAQTPFTTTTYYMSK